MAVRCLLKGSAKKQYEQASGEEKLNSRRSPGKKVEEKEVKQRGKDWKIK